MTQRKRSVALILSALMLPGLAACSGEEAADGGGDNTENTETEGGEEESGN